MHPPEPPPDPSAPAASSSFTIFEHCPTGTFEYFFASDRFIWSDDMFRIYGYEPGQIVPTYEIGQSHVHPDVREYSATFWAEVKDVGGPLSAYLLLQGTKGTPLQALVVGDQIVEEGSVIGVWGIVIDVTHSIHSDSHRLADEAVAASVRKRGVIEQAKGILAGHLGLSTEEAFQVMSQHSQDTNRKVNAIAEDIIDKGAPRITRPVDALQRARDFLKSL